MPVYQQESFCKRYYLFDCQYVKLLKLSIVNENKISLTCEFRHKKGIYFSLTKFARIFRKFETYALTLKFSQHSE